MKSATYTVLFAAVTLLMSAANPALGDLVGEWSFDTAGGTPVANGQTAGGQVDDTGGHASGPYNGAGYGGTLVYQAGAVGSGHSLQFTEATTSPDYDYVDLGMPAAIADITQGAFTVETWFKTTAGDRHTMVGSFESGYSVLNLEITPAGVLQGYIRNAGTAVTTRFYSSGHAGVADGKWHHAALVRESALGIARLYLDGVERGSITDLAGSYSQTSAHMYLGRDSRPGTPSDPNTRFDGSLDETRIWNQALSLAEVQTATFAGINGNALDEHDKLSSVSFGGTATTPEWAVDDFAPEPGASDDLGDGGFDGAYFRTQGAGHNTLTLTFTGLDPHMAVDIGMIVAQLDSLDSDRDDDRFTVKVDGTEIVSFGLGYGPPEPLVHDPFGTTAAEVLATQTLSANVFGTGWVEHMYDLGLLGALQSIPHTSDTLTLEIIGYQNQSSGEFYGLDNISLSLIPEPSSVALAAIGLLGLMPCARRRRRH